MVRQNLRQGGLLVGNGPGLVVQQPGGVAPAGDGGRPPVCVQVHRVLVHDGPEYRLPLRLRREARRQRQGLRHLLLVDEGGGEAVAGHRPRVGDPPAQKRGQAEHPVVRRVKRSRHGTFTASPG